MVSTSKDDLGCYPTQCMTQEDSKLHVLATVNSLENDKDMEFLPVSKPKRYGQSKWTKYRKYRKKWEKDPLLNKWMLRCPESDTRVICRYCQCTIRAHKSILLAHMATSKHINNEENFLSGNFVEKIIMVPKNMRLKNKIEESTITLETKDNLFEEDSNGSTDFDFNSLVMPSSSCGKDKLKKRKVMGPDGSCIIVESEQAMFDTGNGDILTEMADGGHFVQSKKPTTRKSYQMTRRQRKSQSTAGYLTNRIGDFLLSDIEAMMSANQPLSMLLYDTHALDEAKLRRMARMCVAELSRKYLLDSCNEAVSEAVKESEELPEKISSMMCEMSQLKKRLEETVSSFEAMSAAKGDPTNE